MNSRLYQALLSSLLAAAVIAGPVSAQTATNDDTILKQIIIFGRHSVRAPTIKPEDYAQYSTRAYPDFGVQTGFLTVHGQQAATLLGTYYRDYLIAEHLFTGNADTDLAHSFFRANSIQRSNITARMLGEGMIPGATIPVHSFDLNELDPVFEPIVTGVAKVDGNRAAQEVQEIYNSGTALASAYSGEFSLVRSVLYNYQNGVQPAPPVPAGITDPTGQSIPLDAVTSLVYSGNVVDIGGLLSTNNATDPFVMEYADGMPLSDVGWGELSPDALSQQCRLITLMLSIEFTTPYLDQVQSSNAAAHVLRTMRQAVLGEAVPGAFGDPTSQAVVVISSDVYVAGLAGLLRLHWQLPGYQPDYCPPGGALVFELRQSQESGEFLVRVFFTAQSFDQLRNLTPLTQAAPPLTTQLLVPGGSRPGGSLDVKFPVFQKLLTQAMGWQYVQDPATEVQPPVLNDVPLQ